MTDLGLMKYVLGIDEEEKNLKKGIIACQKQYAC